MANNYIGVNNIARKVKNYYIGVNGKARKVKKMYVGVNGKARLCYEDAWKPNWQVSSLPASANWTSVCYGAGKFVAVAKGSNIAAYSIDGINWTQTTLPTSGNWYSVCYGNGKFVAVGSVLAAYSADGINWVSGTAARGAVVSVCYNASLNIFVGAVFNVTNTSGSVVSRDGIIWNLYRMSGSSKGAMAVSCGENIMAMLLNTGYYNYYSTNGRKWVPKAVIANDNNIQANWNSICYGDGKFVGVARKNNIAVYFIDSEIGMWQVSTLPQTADWVSVCYGANKFVTVAYNSNIGAYSVDGIKWAEIMLPKREEWQSICYGDGKFVAVAENSNTVICTST